MKITNYINETRAEIKHVNWPSRGQAIGYTIIIIVFSAVVALLLGAFDSIFSSVLGKLIS